MRSSKSRSRNKANRNNSNQGRNLGNVINRVFDSSGPEGKVRGTPQQIIDKYNQLARDATLGNDRVAAENFQQHAEHYLRLLAEAHREMDRHREEQERLNRERQSERERERAARQDRDGNGHPQGERRDRDRDRNRDNDAAQNTMDLADAPQPEVIDPREEQEESALVETPENRLSEAPAEAAQDKPKPSRPRRPPKPKAEKTQASDATPSDAAE